MLPIVFALLSGPSLVRVSAQEDTLAPTMQDATREPSLDHSAPRGGLRLAEDPPGVSEPILEDRLTAPGIIASNTTCASGRNAGEFVGEGYLLKVTGPCTPGARTALVTPGSLRGIELSGGELRVEFRLVSGPDRASPAVLFRQVRDADGCTGGYTVILWSVPDRQFYLSKDPPGCGSPPVGFGDRTERLARDDWNILAIRLDGPKIWVLLNDAVLLSIADGDFLSGRVSLGLIRTGDVEDTEESAVVFRNLRLSGLATSGATGADRYTDSYGESRWLRDEPHVLMEALSWMES
jgi:hypothetical protein